MNLISFDLNNAAHQGAAAALWRSALGDAFVLGPRAWAFQTSAPKLMRQAGQFAIIDGERAGFVLASVMDGHADVLPPGMGWLDALVIAPRWQSRGLGRELLHWAEEWLRRQGRTRVRVGGGLRYFAPGIATEWNRDFFRAQGYVPRDANPMVQDFGRDLSDYVSPTFLKTGKWICRPAEARDMDAVQTFLAREFPGRWLYEFEQHLREGGRFGDYFLLQTERGVDACCAITFEDSMRPVERYYPAPLPRPWGQVGAIGVSADRRNAGYGSALLDGVLRYMRGRGVRGCIIDWTHHVGYYERFGFERVREYEVMVGGTA